MLRRPKHSTIEVVVPKEEEISPLKTKLICVISGMPIPVAARSKAWIFGRSPAEIVGSNPTGAWMFVCCECYVLCRKKQCVKQVKINRLNRWATPETTTPLAKIKSE